MKKLLIILLIIILGGTTYLLWPKSAVETPLRASESVPEVTMDCTMTESGVLDAVNSFRSEGGLEPVSLLPKLDTYADHRALEQNGMLDSHAGLVGAADELGYQKVGEIQSMQIGCHDSRGQVEMFRSSTAHWDSVMNPMWQDIGIGIHKGVLNINFVQ